MSGFEPPLEYIVQRSIINGIRAAVQPVDVRAVPNAGRRSRWEQQRAKTEGMVAGTPDIFVSWPGGSAWIEVKRPGYAPSAVSQAQAELLAKWRGWGVNAAIATSVDEALALLSEWGAPVRIKDSFVSVGEAAGRVLASCDIVANFAGFE